MKYMHKYILLTITAVLLTSHFQAYAASRLFSELPTIGKRVAAVAAMTGGAYIFYNHQHPDSKPVLPRVVSIWTVYKDYAQTPETKRALIAEIRKTPMGRLTDVIEGASALSGGVSNRMWDFDVSAIFEGLRSLPSKDFDAYMEVASPMAQKFSPGFAQRRVLEGFSKIPLDQLHIYADAIQIFEGDGYKYDGSREAVICAITDIPFERLTQIIEAAKMLVVSKEMTGVEIEKIFKGLRAVPVDHFDAYMAVAYPMMEVGGISCGLYKGWIIERIVGKPLDQLGRYVAAVELFDEYGYKDSARGELILEIMQTPLERLPQIIKAAKALLKKGMHSIEIQVLFEGLRSIPADRFDASMAEAYPIVAKMSSGVDIGHKLKRIAGVPLNEFPSSSELSRFSDMWGLRKGSLYA